MTQYEIYRRASRRAAEQRSTRQIIDLRELGAACTEIAVACAVAAPIAFGYVFCQMAAWA